jgi:phosphatidylinositol alpha-mannosyltransferase
VAWLEEAGHHAWLVGPGVEGPNDARLVGRTLPVRANGSIAPIAIDPRVVAAVREAVAGADVVHVHEPFMPVVGLAAVRASGRVVGTFHADPSRLVRRALRLSGRALRATAGRIDVATAVSDLAAEAVASLIAAEIIPNAIDVAAYRSGRDEPRKGLGVLLEAWPIVRSTVPDAELVVAGASGNDAEGVQFLGRIGEDEKREVLRSAAVMALPNLGGESFGITVAEGMAAGCAVVASGLRAFVAVARDGAQVVPPGDAGALGRAIARLLTDDAAAAALRARAASTVAAYDRPVVLFRYLDAYQRARSA